MDYYEREIVLNYLANECQKVDKSNPIIKKSSCNYLAQRQFEDMSQNARKNILKIIIVNYFADLYSKSLLFNEVNGCPEKRKMRIIEYASHKYTYLTEKEIGAISKIIYNKILIR